MSGPEEIVTAFVSGVVFGAFLGVCVALILARVDRLADKTANRIIAAAIRKGGEG